jgi:hypothetical protein
MQLVNALCNEYNNLNAQRLDQLCHSLVIVFEAAGEMTLLLKWAVEKEVASTSEYYCEH